MIYAFPFPDGKLKGFIDTEYTPDIEIPDDAVLISSELRDEMMVGQWRRDITNPATIGFVKYEPEVVVIKKTKFSSLEFLSRLTDAEKIGIVAAAGSQPSLMLWLLQAMGAAYIDLTDERTIAGINAIRDAGLISTARASEILTP